VPARAVRTRPPANDNRQPLGPRLRRAAVLVVPAAAAVILVLLMFWMS
jgi:hypothetical protein